MTHLASRVAESTSKLAVQDQAAADARAHKDADHVSGSLPRTQCVFAQGSQIHVILQKDRQLQSFRQARRQRDLIPARQVGRVVHESAFRVYGPRRSDAHAGHRVPFDTGIPGCLAGCPGHSLDHGIRSVIRPGGALGLGQDPALCIHDRCQDLGPSKVHSDHVRCDSGICVSLIRHGSPSRIFLGAGPGSGALSRWHTSCG